MSKYNTVYFAIYNNIGRGTKKGHHLLFTYAEQLVRAKLRQKMLSLAILTKVYSSEFNARNNDLSASFSTIIVLTILCKPIKYMPANSFNRLPKRHLPWLVNVKTLKTGLLSGWSI